MSALGDSYVSIGHLLLALAASDSGVGDILPDRDSLAKAASEAQGPHKIDSPDAEDKFEALDQVRPGPDRGRRGGQARPGDRPR